MTFYKNDYGMRESFFATDSELYWDDINNPNKIPYDEELVDTDEFEDDIYTSWINWCNETYADVDEDEEEKFVIPIEAVMSWWDEVQDSFNADDYHY